jgi:glutamate racemase
VSREYTRGLIREFAQGCNVTLVGSARLAVQAEAELNGRPAADGDIADEIAACFVEQGGVRTDTVVLACTHYPLLIARLKALASWPVAWIDPAPAIARRVVGLLGPSAVDVKPPRAVFALTSGREPSADLRHALTQFGF